MRTFSKRVTLLTPDGIYRENLLMELSDAGVCFPEAKVERLWQGDGAMLARLSDGTEHRFDIMYPILGCDVRSQLATRLGASHTKVGCLIVDEHGETNVPGLYAIGDVVSDLHQIAVATGHAAIAATHSITACRGISADDRGWNPTGSVPLGLASSVA